MRKIKLYLQDVMHFESGAEFYKEYVEEKSLQPLWKKFVEESGLGLTQSDLFWDENIWVESDIIDGFLDYEYENTDRQEPHIMKGTTTLYDLYEVEFYSIGYIETKTKGGK